MAANTGLIQLSSQLAKSEAIANVPNLAPLYQSSADMARRGLEMVTGAIDEIKKEEAIDEAGKKQQTDALQKDANGVYKAVYELEETLPNKVVMAIKNEIKNLQKEFELVNTYGENDTTENNDARIRISAQLSRIKNEAVNLRKNLMLMTQDVMGDGGWDLANIRKENIDPLRSILKGELRDMDQNDNISVKFVDGKLTFFTENYSTAIRSTDPEADEWQVDSNALRVAPGEKYQYGDMRMFNSDQMLEMLPRKNNQYLTTSIEQYTAMIALGQNDAIQGTYNYDDQMAVNEANKFIGRVETKDEFQNAARANRKEGIPSLRESLMQRVDIPLAVMNTIFLDENGESIPVGEQLFAILNQNNDNVLDEKDYEAGLKGKNKEAFKIAYKQLLDVYTDIHNKAFNLDASLVLLGQHHEAYSRQHYDQGFEDKGGRIPGKYYPPKGGKTSYIINNTQINESTWQNSYVPFINELAAAEEGQTFASPTGYKYIFENGRYYLHPRKEYENNPGMSFHDVAVNDGWKNYVDTSKVTKGEFGGGWVTKGGAYTCSMSQKIKDFYANLENVNTEYYTENIEKE